MMAGLDEMFSRWRSIQKGRRDEVACNEELQLLHKASSIDLGNPHWQIRWPGRGSLASEETCAIKDREDGRNGGRAAARGRASPYWPSHDDVPLPPLKGLKEMRCIPRIAL